MQVLIDLNPGEPMLFLLHYIIYFTDTFENYTFLDFFYTTRNLKLILTPFLVVNKSPNLSTDLSQYLSI